MTVKEDLRGRTGTPPLVEQDDVQAAEAADIIIKDGALLASSLTRTAAQGHAEVTERPGPVRKP